MLQLCYTVVALVAAAASQAYPVTVTNCGVANTVTSAPTKTITMNQGATEFLLAMGLEGSMVGTAYLDDEIWPEYAAAYASIPVLSSTYPNETHIMAQSPDFIVGSYSSAFRGMYKTSSGMSGIYSNETVGPCEGEGSDWGESWTTCRPQLHAAGIGTYLFEDACENTSLRPAQVTEETVYEEMRALGSIFGVSAETKINEVKDYFDQANQLVSSGMSGAELKTVWLDCVGRCCPEGQDLVGGGTGAPNMLMLEAGLTNIFADRYGNWVCVNVSDIIAAQPDVIVLVDADWDRAIDKVRYLYDDLGFCETEALRAARIIYIPFSATTLSPRNGPAALDLATQALHVRTGSLPADHLSGVGSFSPYLLEAESSCKLCPLSMSYVVYDDTTDSAQNYVDITCTETTTDSQSKIDKAVCVSLGFWWWAGLGAAVVMRPFFFKS